MSRTAPFLSQAAGAPRPTCFLIRQTAAFAASAPLEIIR